MIHYREDCITIIMYGMHGVNNMADVMASAEYTSCHVKFNTSLIVAMATGTTRI